MTTASLCPTERMANRDATAGVAKMAPQNYRVKVDGQVNQVIDGWARAGCVAIALNNGREPTTV
ncbi:diacylglycerol kinase catalytic subunit [Anopheles sinensis]|uniref:Diacylglycerol kinase catalytic subunit n=1 Tax=Anopheles sinensis TaxID=74873 RepID=A0A084VA14_ANOSI|nr:diacylglycerol kinase catalytic subunit [Anopheles sinensis]